MVVLGGVLALALAATVAAPFFLAMEHAQPGYLEYYLFERHVLGAVTTTQRHGTAPWHYYLPVVLGGGLPWNLYAPFSLARLRSRARDNATDQRFGGATRLGWSLLLTGTLFLSLAKSKLLTYALPVFPAIALLAAVAWLAWLERGEQHPSRWFARMRVVQAGVGAMILPAALVFAPAKFPVPHVAWMWVVALTIAGGWWIAARLAARRLDRAAALGATLTAATLAVSLAILVPPVRPSRRRAIWPRRSTARRNSRRSCGWSSNARDRWCSISIPRCDAGSPPIAFSSCRARRCPNTSRCRARWLPSRSGTHRVSPGTCPSRASLSNRRGTTAMYDGERLLHPDVPLHTRPIPSHQPHHRVVDRASTMVRPDADARAGLLMVLAREVGRGAARPAMPIT